MQFTSGGETLNNLKVDITLGILSHLANHNHMTELIPSGWIDKHITRTNIT